MSESGFGKCVACWQRTNIILVGFPVICDKCRAKMTPGELAHAHYAFALAQSNEELVKALRELMARAERDANETESPPDDENWWRRGEKRE